MRNKAKTKDNGRGGQRNTDCRSTHLLLCGLDLLLQLLQASDLLGRRPFCVGLEAQTHLKWNPAIHLSKRTPFILGPVVIHFSSFCCSLDTRINQFFSAPLSLYRGNSCTLHELTRRLGRFRIEKVTGVLNSKVHCIFSRAILCITRVYTNAT